MQLSWGNLTPLGERNKANDLDPGLQSSLTKTQHTQNVFMPRDPISSSVQFTQSCPTLCNPMDCSMLGFPVLHHLPELIKLMSIELVMPSNHLILCHPLLPPSILPSIRVFSNESALYIRWPKYWSFSFSISPSNEHSGLISFRMDWLDLLLSKRLSGVFSNTTVQKHQFFGAQLSQQSNSHIHT